MAKPKKVTKVAKANDEVLIQVRIAVDLHAWIEATVGRTGETVAGWLRKLIIDERRAHADVRAFCWQVAPAVSETADPYWFGVAAEYLLEPLRNIPDGARVFALKTADGPRLTSHRMTNERWMTEIPFLHPNSVCFLVVPVDGLPSAWRFVTSMMRTDGVLEVTLSPMRNA